MLHAFKTPTALTACLVVAAACSSSPAPEKTVANGTKASAVFEQAKLPKASPLNLALLASLARDGQDSGPAVAQKLPGDSLIGLAPEQQITPATTVTYRSAAPLKFDAGAGYPTENLVVVPHDRDVLEGAAYESGAAQARRKPLMDPGTYRTIEYKN